MPKLLTPDGAELDDAEVQRKFAEAMAAPEPDEPTAPAPEPQDPDAPPAEEPAPREQRSHGKARTTAAPRARGGGGGRGRGRPRKAAAAPSAPPPEGTFAGPVAEFLEALTIAGTLIPLPAGELRTKVRLQTGLIAMHVDGLAAAADGAACHNATIRRGVEALTQGSAGWVLPAVLAITPFVAQSLGLWRGPVDEDLVRQADAYENDVRSRILQQQTMGQAEHASSAA